MIDIRKLFTTQVSLTLKLPPLQTRVNLFCFHVCAFLDVEWQASLCHDIVDIAYLWFNLSQSRANDNALFRRSYNEFFFCLTF